MHQINDIHKDPAARRATLKRITAFSQLDYVPLGDVAVKNISNHCGLTT